MVGREFVFNALQSEPAEGDPVGVAPGNHPEKRVLAQIILEVIKAENHIGEVPVLIRNLQGGNGPSVSTHFEGGVLVVG